MGGPRRITRIAQAGCPFAKACSAHQMAFVMQPADFIRLPPRSDLELLILEFCINSETGQRDGQFEESGKRKPKCKHGPSITGGIDLYSGPDKAHVGVYLGLGTGSKEMGVAWDLVLRS
ncbi:hypothetical protein TURU_013581 [Turdus rufiventris]|nr:hypothetical protein TURU_013581 [Turdus rufiventris]